MTIANNTNMQEYVGNGSQKDFTVPFLVYEDTHLIVSVQTGIAPEDVKTLGSEYTVTGAGDPTCVVSLVAAPAIDDIIRIRRWVPMIQETDLVNNSSFDAETLERTIDETVMMIQQVAQKAAGGTEWDDTGGQFMGRMATDTEAWDAEDRKISNVADPVAVTDAINLRTFQVGQLVMGNLPTLGAFENNYFIVSSSGAAPLWQKRTAAQARTQMGLGTAAVLNTGTANGNVVLLTATGLPAVAGDAVTGNTKLAWIDFIYQNFT